MTINTRRVYTADDIARLTAAQAQADALDQEVREVMAEVSTILNAVCGEHFGWQLYAEQYGIAPLVDALDLDKHPMATANTSYIPQIGHLWNSRWNPTMWEQRNRRTRRDIDNLRKAIARCEVAA